MDDDDDIPGLSKDSTVLDESEDGSKSKGSRAEDSKYWKSLADEAAKSTGKKAREAYETLLRRFPQAEKLWVQYCDMELKGGNAANVERLLKRSLKTLESVRLWLFYVKYVTESLLGPKSEAAANPGVEKASRKKVEEAYEYAIRNVGYSFEAGSIWKEYIRFIESERCDSQFELTTKAAAVRTAYVRAVKLPVLLLEDLWRGYEQLGGGGNTSPEVQQEYMKAKAIYQERQKRLQGLQTDDLPEPYSGSSSEERVLQRWRAVIEYERGNPERTSDVELKRRVRHVYSKALNALFFYPEVWYEFALFEQETNDNVSSLAVLERALHAVPDSLLLQLCMADSFEAAGQQGRAREVYEQLESKMPCPLVYIQFQLFERRSLDGGVGAARAVFRRARKSPQGCAPSVFASAALMELRCNKEPSIARNVFELGIKRYPRDAGLVFQYIDFLEACNQDTDLIALIERVLGQQQLEQRDLLRVWERYREICYRFSADAGGLKRVMALERRMAQAFPDRKDCLTGLPGLVHRYAFLGSRPMLAADKSFVQRSRRLSLGPRASAPAASSSASSLRLTGADDAKALLLDQDGTEMGEQDGTILPKIVKQLEAMLPFSLGAETKPIGADYVVSHIASFKLPPKNVFTGKKKRKTDAAADDSLEAVDLFNKRKKTK